MTTLDIEQLGINVIRGLAMDGPEAANAGHPGTAMALAPLAHVLWTRVLRYDADAPYWPDRDRFVLSCGHASILQYSMLYLTGYGLTLDDLRAFRQFGSRTPGHPEWGHTTGIEVTTGPLGQGFGNSVGMAVAERLLRTRFGSDVVDHHTYVVCSDGDFMEGISHEAASLAGHLGLGRLIAVYDDNHITIDGVTELAFTDDTAARFEAYGWHVDRLGEAANDVDALEAALRRAAADEDRPSLLVLRSHIGWPSPNKVDTSAAHGNPLGADEIRLTKGIMGMPDEPFWVPDEVLAHYREAGRRGREDRLAWERRLGALDPAKREAFDAGQARRGLEGWATKLPTWDPGASVATRAAVGACFNAVVDTVPGLVTGGADLTENTGTFLDGQEVQSREHPGGRLVHFGVREHAMAASLNGMAAHAGVVPAGGTFFVFSDYARPSVRLAALSGYKSLFVFTHDSVGLGEDGPTHQPIEQLASLRAMPGMRVIRPADANETAHAVRVAIDGDGPVTLVLSRQKLPVLEGTIDAPLDKGAYVLRDPSGPPALVLVGTGSEVSVCLGAADLLAADGIAARVVSMPSWDLFELAGPAWQDEVLPPGVPKLSVEAAATFGWGRWVDASVGIDRFGASAPGDVVLRELGIEPANVAEHARSLLARSTADRSTP